MAKKVSELIVSVEKHIYQVAGTGVQLYAEDVIAQKLKDCYTLIFDDYDFEEFKVIETKTLDGSTGRIVGTFDSIVQFNDIKSIYVGSSTRPLTKVPFGMNTASIVGTRSRYYMYSGVVGKLIQVLPATATDVLTVLGKARYNGTWGNNDTINIDETVLTLMASWHYMTDDGANAAAAATLQNLFETRLKQLKVNQSGAVLLNDASRSYEDRWTDTEG